MTRDEEGFLYFVGRKDDMIKSSGYRLSPTELEEVIYESSLVSEVAAIGVPHPRLGQGIVVVVVGASMPVDESALLAWCRSKLPAYMVPHRVYEQETLARNANGKIDRKALQQCYQSAFEDELL